MLNAYVLATQRLLSNPAAPSTLYSTSDITGYINTARLQMAGETECVRLLMTLAVSSAANTYPFSSFVDAGAPSDGVAGVYALRQMLRNSGTGFVYMGSRPYTWALTYWLNNPSPVKAAPTEWSQFKIGSSGSLILNPGPDMNYTLTGDIVGTPAALASDADPEAIPYAFTDAVPYFAAYYAYMSSQRQGDADRMYGRYQEFVLRAKRIAVPNVLPMQYDQNVAPQAPAAPPQAGG